MPADNQLGDHGDMWSHCFPKGIVNAASMKSMLMVINWYKTEITQYFYKWCFFYIHSQIENMNRKGILWVKASEGTAILCETTPHPQHGMGKITFKVL